jgi:hypothetical protein
VSAKTSPKQILEPARKTNVYKEADVVVVGGGVAGVSAAVASARNGASTILVERYGHLGGLATGGLVLVIMPMSDGTKNQQVAGICQEMVDRLDEYGGCIHPQKEDIGSIDEKIVGFWRRFPFCVIENRVIMSVPFDPEAYKCVLNDMIEDSGVKLCLHSWGTQAIVENDTVKGVIFESKEGRQAILGKVTIDTTGDGDILATAGADYADTITNELRADMALPFRIGKIDFKKFNEFRRNQQPKFNELMKELGGQLGLGSPAMFNYFILRYSQMDAAWVNNSIKNRSGLSVEDLTWVEVDVRKKMWLFRDFYRKNMPGFEDR